MSNRNLMAINPFTLKFKGFQGNWEDISSKVAFKRIKTKNLVGETNVLTISAQRGLISQEEYFNKSVSSKNLSGYYLIKNGEFAYNKSYSTGYPMGAIKKLTQYNQGVVSPLYICFSINEKILNSDFFQYYCDAGYLNSELSKLAQEGARNHGLLNIGLNDFFNNISFRVPDIKEQEHIAECFYTLDEFINIEVKKLNVFKMSKNALLQQLFPHNGASIPKLRFPEFSNVWESIELSKIAKPVRKKNSTEDDINVLSLSNEYGLVSQADYFLKKVAGDNTDRYILLQKNDFVYNDRYTKNSTYGTIKRLSLYDSGIVSPIYKCFRFEKNQDPVFWEYFFESKTHESEIMQIVNEGARAGRYNISIDKFLSINVMQPSSTEQEKIASCLTSLDRLISNQTNYIDQLKRHKKGLMQQLFPIVEEI